MEANRAAARGSRGGSPSSGAAAFVQVGQFPDVDLRSYACPLDPPCHAFALFVLQPVEADVAAEEKADKPLGTASSRRSAAGSVLSQRVRTTLSTAAATGLIQGKKGKQLSGRVHETLFEAAATKSGLRGTELIDYALAKVALEDDFAKLRLGAIALDVDLGA